MEKQKRKHGRSGQTYENKKRQMTKRYNTNVGLQEKYKTLDNFLTLLKKQSPSRS